MTITAAFLSMEEATDWLRRLGFIEGKDKWHQSMWYHDDGRILTVIPTPLGVLLKAAYGQYEH